MSIESKTHTQKNRNELKTWSFSHHRKPSSIFCIFCFIYRSYKYGKIGRCLFVRLVFLYSMFIFFYILAVKNELILFRFNIWSLVTMPFVEAWLYETRFLKIIVLLKASQDVLASSFFLLVI